MFFNAFSNVFSKELLCLSLVCGVFSSATCVDSSNAEVRDRGEILDDDKARLKTGVQAILKDHWKVSAANRRLSEKAFADTSSKLRASSQFQHAYLLNRIQHQRYETAYEIAASLVEDSPSNVDLLYLKTWLEILTGRTDRALLSIQDFRKQLDGKEKPSKERREQSISRIARLFGFIKHVRGENANPATLEQATRIIVGGLEDKELKQFYEVVESVEKRANGFTTQSNAIQTVERDKLIAQRNKEIQRLSEVSQRLQLRLQQLEPQLDERRASYEDKRDKIEAQADPLRSALSRLDASAITLEQQLNFMYQDLFFTENAAWRARDRFTRLALLNRADNIAFNIRNAEANLAGVYAEGRGASQELGVLSGQLNRERAQFQSDTSVISAEVRDLQKTLRSNSRKAAKLAKAPTVQSGKLVSIDNRRSTLRTYDPLPLEMLRKQLLDRLGKE